MEEEEEGVAEATHDFWKKGKRVEERRAKKKDGIEEREKIHL